MLTAVSFRGPHEQRHVGVVLRRAWRSVQEQAARVVEYVLAMVGRVHHCRHDTGRAQLLDDAVQDVVGLQNGVVVGVDKLRTVVGLCIGGRVGRKAGT